MAAPRIGDQVYYYPVLSATKEMAAMVTDVYSNDLVSLAVWEAGRWVSKKSVHNRNCKSVKENPIIGANFGVWDYRDPPEVRNALNELVYGSAGTSQSEKRVKGSKAPAEA